MEKKDYQNAKRIKKTNRKRWNLWKIVNDGIWLKL